MSDRKTDRRIVRIKARWLRLSNEVSYLNTEFRKINCSHKELIDFKSEEDVFTHKICKHEGHGYAGDRYHSRCAIELCPM